MKKVLALVLALAMVLGCFSTVFAVSYSDVTAADDFSEAVGVLSDLGVVSGYPDGTYLPEKVVTRAEMAALIVNALGLTPSGSTTTQFTDVKSADWFAGYVAFAYSLGIIAGRSETIFDPNATVSYDEAIVMLINALGYTGSLKGTYPTAFVIKAQELGITDGVKTLGSAGAVRGDVAQLIYNTLGCEIGTTDTDGNWEANKNGADTMFARLGAVADSTKYIVGGAEVNAETSSIDLSEYFGAVVKVFWDGTKSGKKVVAIDEVVTEFVTIDDFDSDDFTSNWKVDSLNASFKNGDDEKTTLTETAVKAIASDTILAVVKSGSKIKTVYTAQTWEAKNTVRMTSSVISTLAKDSKLDGFYFDMEDEDDDVIDTDSFILVGADSLDAIAEDSIVTYYLNKANKIVKIEVSTKTVEGSIDKVNSAADSFTIDGTVYKKSAKATAEAAAAKLGDEGTFFLDYAGKIFAFDATETKSDWLFGVVLATGQDKDRYSNITDFVKMFTADGIVELEVVTTGTPHVDMSDFTKYALTAYQLDDDGLVCNIKPATEELKLAVLDGKEVSAKGVVANMTIADDVVVLSNTVELADDDEYTVGKKADYLGKTFTTADCFYDVETGNIVAIFVDAALADDSEDTEVVAVVTSNATSLNKDKYDYAYEFNALYEGEAKSFYSTVTAAKFTTSAAIAGGYQTFDMDSDGAVTKINAKSVVTTVVKADGETDKVAFSNSVLKIGTKSYTIADDAVVFVYDLSAAKWTYGEVKSYAKGDYDTIVLLDLCSDAAGDAEYDVVYIIVE